MPRATMDIAKKLHILADAAKYDASCASSGSRRSHKKGELGDSGGVGICHSYTPDGRCISLLKILLTNYCIYDCLFCINRTSSDVARARFTPGEVAQLTIDFYKRNYIEGLFLSSGIIRNPDYTTEQVIQVARLLREEYRFNGYIHLKAAPGTSPELLEELSCWADRVSANIELPTEKDLSTVAPAKKHSVIEQTMRTLSTIIAEKQSDKIRLKRERKPTPRTLRWGTHSQSTQMVVGATTATDKDILLKSQSLYQTFKLKRVYYSAYSPIPHSAPLLPTKQIPLVREHRLYQADWLFRFYGFGLEEVTATKDGNLDLEIDPKLSWALEHRSFFPVNVNKASRSELLRIPGLGVTNVDKILLARRFRALTLADLKRLRVSLNRAQYFIETADPNFSLRHLESPRLRGFIIRPATQLPLFSPESFGKVL
jgi:putative DNA modification/repair radical SAM protein